MENKNTPHWEYYSYLNAIGESSHNAMNIADLNGLGAEGWELVTITVDDLGHWRYTFKRQKDKVYF